MKNNVLFLFNKIIIGSLILLLMINISNKIENVYSDAPILLVGIGMHVEPIGPTAQIKDLPKTGGYYNNRLYNEHVEDIKKIVSIVEKYSGLMTIQVQSPFTEVINLKEDEVLSEFEQNGHEIALHFHEEAHLGKNSNSLPFEKWCEVMKEEIELVKKTGVKNPIRFWSGGNLYEDILKAAYCAGLDINSDYKNPKTQKTSELLLGVNPFKPSGGPKENDLTEFATHDPNGKIIYLPIGAYNAEKFAKHKEIVKNGGDSAWFEVLKESFDRSLEVAKQDRVNVFQFTIHPGEFKGETEQPFQVMENFIKSVIDPAVKQGKAKWATYSEMADAFIHWEEAHPGINPKENQNHHSLIFAMETLPNSKNEQKLIEELSLWHKELPFQYYGLKIIPSSDNNENASLIQRVNKIGEAVNQDIIPSTQFIGLIKGYHISREEWWDNICNLECSNIGLVFSLNKETSPEEAEEYLNRFVEVMHQHNKKVFLWCSANMLFRSYLQRFRDWFEKFNKNNIDYFVWMDMPGVEVKEKISATDQAKYILSICPKEKTYFQWVNARWLPTENPEGTMAYAKKLITAGADNFCILGNSRLLSDQTWYDFYKNLSKNLFE